MKYSVSIAGQVFNVEITGDGVRMNGRVVSAQLELVPHTPLRQIVVDGGSTTFAMVRAEEGWVIQSAGRPRFRTSVLDRFGNSPAKGSRSRPVGWSEPPCPASFSV
jgi:hypothetical protein